MTGNARKSLLIQVADQIELNPTGWRIIKNEGAAGYHLQFTYGDPDSNAFENWAEIIRADGTQKIYVNQKEPIADILDVDSHPDRIAIDPSVQE